MHQQKTYNFCKELMALPYLPEEWIEPVFQQMSAKELPSQLRQLIDYVDAHWIKHKTFVIGAWSVYKRQFRTNNDCEGIIVSTLPQTTQDSTSTDWFRCFTMKQEMWNTPVSFCLMT